MDIKKIYKDFSIFHDEDFAYLDTAATSLTPDLVADKVDSYYKKYRANIHRGLYKNAERATKEYEKARNKVADFIDAKKNEIIFTSGATMSSNMLVYALENSQAFKQGDEIVTTKMEHHAGLLPLMALAKRKKMTVRYIDITNDFNLDYKQAERLITKKTKIVSVILASNVLGTINDVNKIIKLAKAVGAVSIVDATAVVGHVPISMEEIGSDFMYFSGHKMCAPTGVGVLYGKADKLKKLEPGLVGGGMVEDVNETCATWSDAPEKFEAGTPNISGAIGLGVAVEYLEKIGIENIQKHCRELVEYTQDRLKNVKGVKIYSAKPQNNVGIVSFTLDGVHPHDVAEVLARSDVAVRAGHHCALPLHKSLKLSATVRASVYMYNKKEDIDKLIKGIEEVKQIFGK